MNPVRVQKIIREALNEDLGTGDLTTEALIGEEDRSEAVLRVRQPGVIAGLPIAEQVFRFLDPDLTFTPLVTEGAEVDAGRSLARIKGKTRALLSAERVALNFMQRMSGIATVTREAVKSVGDTNCRILDTRKTTPGLRILEKYAVRIGGGTNHRYGLGHGVLIKDNHIAAVGSITEAVRRVRKRVGHMVQVEVEVETLEQLEEVLSLDIDAILLDNMDLDTLREAVKRIDGRFWTEASGGLTPEKVRAVAETGVDGISLGWLTHSAPSLDISLDWEEYKGESRND